MGITLGSKRRGIGVVAGLVLVLIGSELGLRLIGFGDPPLMVREPSIEYYSKPGSYRQFHSLIQINAVGMRGPELQEPKPYRRVLLIGDSIVAGTFRLDQDELISVTLQRELANLTRDSAGGRATAEVEVEGATVERVEVLNAAANSWGPVNQLAYLSRVGTFDADAAVWILSSHDLTDVPVPGAAALLPTEPFSFAMQDAINVVRRRLAQEQVPYEQAERQSLAAVDGVIRLLRSQSIPFFVAFHWTEQELQAGELSPYGERLLAHLTSRGVQSVSLEPILSRTEQPYADSIHLTPAGAREIGQHLAPLVHALMVRP